MGALIRENAIFAFAVKTFLKNSTYIKILYFTKIRKNHKINVCEIQYVFGVKAGHFPS